MSKYLACFTLTSNCAEKWQRDTTEAAITTYKRQQCRADMGKAPLHRSRDWNAAARIRAASKLLNLGEISSDLVKLNLTPCLMND